MKYLIGNYIGIPLRKIITKFIENPEYINTRQSVKVKHKHQKPERLFV